MKVTMPQGQVFEHDDPMSIVDLMCETQWTTNNDLAEYMQRVAADVQGATGRVMHTDDPLRFLFDLEQAGVILSVEYLTTDEARQFNEWQQGEWEPDDQPHGDSNDDNEA
jgi:hypothetical protein